MKTKTYLEVCTEARKDVENSKVYESFMNFAFSFEKLKARLQKRGKDLSPKTKEIVSKGEEEIYRKAQALCNRKSSEYKLQNKEDYVKAFWFYYDIESILGKLDGVSKWVEQQATPKSEAKVGKV